jgi:hypothetical protein
MKSNCIFFTTLMLAAPAAFWLQGSALAQATGGTNTPPPALENGARLAANVSTFRDNVDFYFPGGNPRQFLRAVDEQYQVDWMSVADIPVEMQQVHIPALRMSRESLERMPARGRGLRAGRGGGGGGGFGGGGGGGGVATNGFVRGGGAVVEQRDPLQALVALYDNLGQAEPEIGELRVVGDLAKPSIVLFRPTAQPSTTSDFKMKAYALKGTPENEWPALQSLVNQELKELALIQGSQHVAGMTRVSLHTETGLLIVLGPESVQEAAESLVTAWRRNHQTAVLPSTSPSTIVPK